jgi:hypothetical protein
LRSAGFADEYAHEDGDAANESLQPRFRATTMAQKEKLRSYPLAIR